MLLSDQLKAANMHFKAVDYEKAIAAYTALMEACKARAEGRFEGPTPEDSMEDAQKISLSALLNRCSCYCQNNEWALGLSDALLAETLAPLDPRVPLRTAIAYQGLRQFQQALDVCKAGLEVHPNDTSLLNVQARSEAALGLGVNRSAAAAPWSPSHFSKSQNFHTHDHGHGHGHSHEHAHDHTHDHNHLLRTRESDQTYHNRHLDDPRSHSHEHVYSAWLASSRVATQRTPVKASSGYACAKCELPECSIF